MTPVVLLSAAPTLQTAGWTSLSTVMVPGEPFTPSSLSDSGPESLKHCLAPGVSGRQPAQAKEAEGLIFFFFSLSFFLMTNAYAGTAVSSG